MNAYDAKEAYCRRCLDELPDVGKLREYLAGYAASLPEEQRVDDGTYSARLLFCERCSMRAGLLCTVCGCYVQARAAKKRQRCPRPGGALWERIE